MALTFETLIQHNKKVSNLLVACIVIFTCFAGGVFYTALVDPSPANFSVNFQVGVALGASLSCIGALISYFLGAKILMLVSSARRVEPFEDKVLFNVVEEMTIAAGLPMPAVYVIYDEAPNAFASGRDPQHAYVCITSGLRRKLNRDELQAVIAHELAHIKNYDIRLMMLIAVFAGLVVLLSDFFWRHFIDTHTPRLSSRQTGRQQSRGKSDSAFAVMFILLALILAWVAPIVAKLLQLAISREREYLADATAVQFCRNPLALASALRKIAMDPEDLACDNRATEHLFIVNPNPQMKLQNQSDSSIWSTHPPTIKRIERLLKLAEKGGSAYRSEELG